MNTAHQTAGAAAPASAIETACGAIAPSWPLDRQIAVNPYWGFVDRPFPQAAATLRSFIGARFALGAGDYLSAWRSGQITPTALSRALSESSNPVSPDSAVAALHADWPESEGLPLLSDTLDRDGLSGGGPLWTDTITQQVSQFCASYFDEHQADWHRDHTSGLFAAWRSSLQVDHALQPLMRAPQIRARAQALPTTAEDAIDWALRRLQLPPQEHADLLQVCLLRINGWASWCAYMGWEARLCGRTDRHLIELMAIRVSWEALLHEDSGEGRSSGSEWRKRWSDARLREPSPFAAHELLWQRAHEIGYQQGLVAQLQRKDPPTRPSQSEQAPALQLVFCIDVRSERLRRALEHTDPGIGTRGFAGFFGLPIQYMPIAIPQPRPQLPGLLAPALDASDSTGRPSDDARIGALRVRRLQRAGIWQSLQRLPSGAFSFVEALGIGYAGAMLRKHFGSGRSAPSEIGLGQREKRALRPTLRLTGGDTAGQKAQLVASILRAMSLTQGFSRLLVLVGHGSQSANNPQSAALDCGACGGQTGEINARVLSSLINDPAVRGELRTRGIDLPETTLAIGALHNTTTDEVHLFDLDQVPPSHSEDLERLKQGLQRAGELARAERASGLGLGKQIHRADDLLKRMRRKARDWAETRPEWGLADNAAFIVAPRSRTRGLDLQGRVFLHDYTASEDHDGAVLELIMTAPMIVTHWINLQYFASTVDPQRFGSGNKVLHNVACGRIGVFEGNTGDLRIGLSRQSVHDGENWRHSPLRLSVFIDAPIERIESVIARHPMVRQLVDNQWLYLFRFTDTEIQWRNRQHWQPWE